MTKDILEQFLSSSYVTVNVLMDRARASETVTWLPRFDFETFVSFSLLMWLRVINIHSSMQKRIGFKGM